MNIYSTNGTILYKLPHLDSLENLQLSGANLISADLRNHNIRHTDFSNAYLCRTDLRNLDFRKSRIFWMHVDSAKMTGCQFHEFDKIPLIENIHSTLYLAASKRNALNMKVWHTSDKIHCWAGWVIHLADAYGFEQKYGPSLAAAMIYMKSDPNMEQIPNWYLSESDALAAMHRLAFPPIAA